MNRREIGLDRAYEKKIGQDTPKNAGLRNVRCVMLDGRNAYLAAGEHLPNSDPLVCISGSVRTINNGALSKIACKNPPLRGPSMHDSLRSLRTLSFESGMIATRLNQKISSGVLFCRPKVIPRGIKTKRRLE
jgi:hypothetical protein